MYDKCFVCGYDLTMVANLVVIQTITSNVLIYRVVKQKVSYLVHSLGVVALIFVKMNV